jgi:hypothetical protein
LKALPLTQQRSQSPFERSISIFSNARPHNDVSFRSTLTAQPGLSSVWISTPKLAIGPVQRS